MSRDENLPVGWLSEGSKWLGSGLDNEDLVVNPLVADLAENHVDLIGNLGRAISDWELIARGWRGGGGSDYILVTGRALVGHSICYSALIEDGGRCDEYVISVPNTSARDRGGKTAAQWRLSGGREMRLIAELNVRLEGILFGWGVRLIEPILATRSMSLFEKLPHEASEVGEDVAAALREVDQAIMDFSEERQNSGLWNGVVSSLFRPETTQLYGGGPVISVLHPLMLDRNFAFPKRQHESGGEMRAAEMGWAEVLFGGVVRPSGK